jgi:transposase-like protein
MDKRVTTGRISRRKHDEAFKRELVERSLQPGASVAAIAQDNASTPTCCSTGGGSIFVAAGQR